MTSSQPEDIRWQRPQPLTASEDQTALPTPRTAVLIFHGWVAAPLPVVERCRRNSDGRMRVPLGTSPVIQTRQVKADNEWISRAEITLKENAGTEREIHLYEAYWAALTEGKVTAHDVDAVSVHGGLAGDAK